LSANEKMTDKRSQETSGRMSSPETSEGISQHICKCSIAKGVAVPTLKNRSQTPRQSPCSRGSQHSHWKGQVSRDICQGLDDNMGKDCDLKRSERHTLLESSANVQSSRWTCHPLLCDSCCSATNLSPPQTRDRAGMLACGPRCPCKALLPRTKSHAKGPAAEQIQSWQKARLLASKSRSQHRDLDVWVVLKPYIQERNTKLHNAKIARIVIKTPGCLTMMMCIYLVHSLSHVHNIWINYACQEGALLSTPA
jgi:hypothetical protein